MEVVKRMCKGCPYRGIDEAERKSLAVLPADEFPCHEESWMTGDGPQCRGHYEARRKYPSTETDLVAVRGWQARANEAYLNGSDFEEPFPVPA